MTDKEIQDIFAEELSGKSTDEALIGTHYKISVSILERLARHSLSDDVWELLLGTSYAKSYLCMLWGVSSFSIVQMSKKLLKEILFSYEQWLKIVCYLYDNYNTLKSDEFRALWVMEHLIEMRGVLTKRLEELNEQFLIAETVILDQKEIKVMDQVFSWAKLTFLGKEVFEQYAKEFNEAMIVLRKYRAELLLLSD